MGNYGQILETLDATPADAPIWENLLPILEILQVECPELFENHPPSTDLAEP